MKAEEILYEYGDQLYVNLTNRCPCRCDFCIRGKTDGLGTADSLWLDHDPSAQEVITALKGRELARYQEVVFCGYGEPFCDLEVLLEVCRWLREHTRLRTRINTNGLGDLIQGSHTPPLLEGLVDAVSISLNTSDPDYYLRLCHPSFGEKAYGAMLQFAQDCKKYVPEVKFSVVDVIPKEDIEGCRQLSQKLGVPLRVRHYVS